MKKLLLLPTAFFPYSVCLCGGYGFVSGHLRNDPILTALAILALFCGVLALVGNIVFMVLSRGQSASALCKTALILKLIHIPAYTLIFLVGLLVGFMFFMTLPFILFLIAIDGITLFLSGMISVFSLLKQRKNNRVLCTVGIICQFFFCADVISLIVLAAISKRATNTVSV